MSLNKGRGFTLVELLVVIAIIGILIALLLPAVQAAREAARRSQCTNNLKQLGLAMQNYHSANKKLPYGARYENPGKTAYVLILPFIEEQGVLNLYSTDPARQATLDPLNKQMVETPIKAYTCPSDPAADKQILTNRSDAGHNPINTQGNWYPLSAGPMGDVLASVHNAQGCSYCPRTGGAPASWCCQGINFGATDGIVPGLFTRYAVIGGRETAVKFKQVTDGLSKTIMLGETLPHHSIYNGAYNNNFPVSCTHIPINIMRSDNGAANSNREWTWTTGYKSMHAGGTNLAMADGSVRFTSEGIDYRLYVGLGTKAGGEIGSIP